MVQLATPEVTACGVNIVTMATDLEGGAAAIVNSAGHDEPGRDRWAKSADRLQLRGVLPGHTRRGRPGLGEAGVIATSTPPADWPRNAGRHSAAAA